MGKSTSIFCLFSLSVILPALCSSHHTFVRSRASYYGSPDGMGTANGACGYGVFGRTIYGGNTADVGNLYRNGAGCGACYRVRCTIPGLCATDGVKVVATDYGQGDNTDFILSPRGFTSLARPNMAAQLKKYGTVDIEYRRVSCQYPGHNLMFKIHENSNFPDYIAIIILYQGGKQDVTAVQLWKADTHEWIGMRRAYGAVWDLANPPRGFLHLRFFVGQRWVQPRNVIPGNWKAGVAYDSGLQLYKPQIPFNFQYT